MCELVEGLAPFLASYRTPFNVATSPCRGTYVFASAEGKPNPPLLSDIAVTIYFAARFVRLLIEGGYYLRAATI